jgi:hypothetical protein
MHMYYIYCVLYMIFDINTLLYNILYVHMFYLLSQLCACGVFVSWFVLVLRVWCAARWCELLLIYWSVCISDTLYSCTQKWNLTLILPKGNASTQLHRQILTIITWTLPETCTHCTQLCTAASQNQRTVRRKFSTFAYYDINITESNIIYPHNMYNDKW